MGGAAIISSPQRRPPESFDAAAAETRFAQIAGGKQVPYSDVDNALILRALRRQADVVRLTPVRLPNGTVLETEVRFGAHAGSSSTGMVQVDLATQNTLTVVRLLAKGQNAASPLKVKAARRHQPVAARTPTGDTPGEVVRCWYRERDWPPEKWAAYQVKLAVGALTYVPTDDDNTVRLLRPDELATGLITS